nr:chitobiase/beta-hexosaminidase C-terminal domain-containing protein [uncultured Flavonifractor sp.]
MKVLLDAFGIENAYIEGWAYNTNNRPNGEQHAWNYVKLDDGTGNTQWYALDPTWDDPQLSILPARQVYFLVGSGTETEKNFNGYETFGKNHDSSAAKSPAYTTWKLTYPALAQQARDPSADGNVLLQGADGSSRSYDTLEAAMNDAVSGDTLVLQNAVSLSNTLVLKDGVTLDLNGQTGGNASSPCAVTSTASPVFRVEAGGSAAITNSMGFTTVKTSAASVTVVENNGTLNLGTNIQLSGGTTPMGSAAVISGNAPKLAPHTRYVAVSKFVTTYLVAQPQDPAPDSYQAQEGDTVQDLLNARPGPAVAMQYYGNMGNLINIPGTEYTLDWKLQQGPNGGQPQPTDPLENGSYVFEAQAYDYTISYEVEVSGLVDPGPQEISAVALTGLDAPVAGQPLDTGVAVATEGVLAGTVTWQPESGGTADYDTVYTATIPLTAEPGYAFTQGAAVTVDGQPAQAILQADGTLSVQVTFPATPSKTVYLQSIQTPAPVSAANGTALDALVLPAQVQIVTDDSAIHTAQVTWTRVPADGTSYEPGLKTEQTFQLEGIVTLPEGVDANGVALTVRITVVVAAAPEQGQTDAPTAQPAPGRYSDNQSVILTSATPGAVIYYTLDGSQPTAAGGILYTGPISLTGTPGAVIKTQIKAIAVCDGLRDSGVVSLEYEIALPDNSGSGSDGGDSGNTGGSGSDGGDSGNTGGGSGGGDSGNTGGSGSDGGDSGNTGGGSGGGNSGNTGGSGSGGGNSGSTGGSSSSGGSSGNTGGSSSGSNGNKTEVTKHPDGSTTTTVTRPDGSSVSTTKQPDGSKEQVETAQDGTVTTTMEHRDGSTSITVAAGNGSLTSKAEVSTQRMQEAQQKGEAVALPMPPVPVTGDRSTASAVTVDLPAGITARVEIPVKDVTPGTVAVLVKANGEEEIIKTTVTTQTGVAVKISDGDTVKIIDNSKQFVDVPSTHWGADAVGFVASRTLFSGTGEQTFSPDAPMNRGMIVTVLARLEGVDTASNPVWYEAGRQWAVAKGISDGAHLDQDLTREQLALMLYRYAGQPASAGTLSGYTDGDKVSDWAVQAMGWAVNEGLISGGGNHTLDPQGQATRAQVAAILQRFIEADKV